jgi:hypothetical protein
MSGIEEIDVFISPDGTVKVEVRGVKGTQCINVTKRLEELLGSQVVERTHTGEFDEAEQELTRDDHLRQRGS